MSEPTLQEKIESARKEIASPDDAMLAQYKKIAGFLFEATSAKTTMYLCFGIIGLQVISVLVLIMTLKR